MLKGGKFCAGILADWDHSAKIVLSEDSTHQNFRTVSVSRILSYLLSTEALSGHLAVHVSRALERSH